MEGCDALLMAGVVAGSSCDIKRYVYFGLCPHFPTQSSKTLDGDMSHRLDRSVFGSKGFPGSSAGKESTCNAGDPGSIPRLGRSTGEEIGYPLQYSWASLVAQLVKNLPVMREIWAQSLGWEDPLEKGKATHSSILAWRIPWTIQSMGSQGSEKMGHFHFLLALRQLLVEP